MEIDIEEDENEPELTYPYEEVDPLNPPSPASESEPDDEIKVENLIEHEDKTVLVSVYETAHALVEKKGRAKDKFYGKLILDLGNEVRSNMEQGTDAMEKLVEKLGNTKDKVECKKLKRELEEARIMPPKSAPMTQAAIRRMIKESVDAAIAAERARQANVRNDASGSGPVRGRDTAPAVRECTFAGFMKCNPAVFRRVEGAVELRRWFEKTKSVFEISECVEGKKVKFAAATLEGPALTWWKTKVATMGLETVNQMPWTEMKQFPNFAYVEHGFVWSNICKKLNEKDVYCLVVHGCLLCNNGTEVQRIRRESVLWKRYKILRRSIITIDNEDLERLILLSEEWILKWRRPSLYHVVKEILNEDRGWFLNFNGKEAVGFVMTKVKCYNCHGIEVPLLEECWATIGFWGYRIEDEPEGLYPVWSLMKNALVVSRWRLVGNPTFILYWYNGIFRQWMLQADVRKNKSFLQIVFGGSGQDWLFHIDLLTNSMNYEPVIAGNQTNRNAEDKVVDDAGKKDGVLDPAKEDDKSGQGEATNTNSTNKLNSVSSSINTVSSSFTTMDPGRERAQRNEFESVFGQDKDANGNSIYRMFTPVNAAGSSCDNLGGSIPVNAATLPNADLPTDPLMPDLEDTADLLNTGIFSGAYDDEDEGAEADLNNLEITMNVSPIPTTSLHKDHPKYQIIGDINLATQTRRMTKIFEEHAMVSYIKKQRRTNHKDYQNCLFACFLSQSEPKKVTQALTDPSWIEAMQDVSTVYVDDIIFGSTKKSLCTEFESLMHRKFQMSSMGQLTFFLGLQVMQRDDGIFISQDKSMIGSLMYLTDSNLDIMFAICAYARFQVTLKVSHLHTVKRIFRYLKGQPKLGLWYPRDLPFNLEAFSDSDYAGASLDRKSTTGGCQFLGKRLISWQCKKQTIVANSTTKVEYVAAAN
ncbi:uncharacterized mitochondrial protein-like protein [Tanacetum coccineum]